MSEYPASHAFDAILFDMDDTLVPLTYGLSVYTRTVEQLAGYTCTAEQIIATFTLGSTQEALTTLIGRPATGADLARFFANFESLPDVQPFTGINETLQRLVDQHIALGVVTGATRRGATTLLGKAGLLNLFKTVIGGDEVARPKSAPEGLHLACRRLGIAPANTAYVGDSRADIATARAAGVTAIAAVWAHNDAKHLDADITIRHPRDLRVLVQR
jgi:HAD superfamily hydrolase (TIGR01549 family)